MLSEDQRKDLEYWKDIFTNQQLISKEVYDAKCASIISPSLQTTLLDENVKISQVVNNCSGVSRANRNKQILQQQKDSFRKTMIADLVTISVQFKKFSSVETVKTKRFLNLFIARQVSFSAETGYTDVLKTIYELFQKEARNDRSWMYEIPEFSDCGLADQHCILLEEFNSLLDLTTKLKSKTIQLCLIWNETPLLICQPSKRLRISPARSSIIRSRPIPKPQETSYQMANIFKHGVASECLVNVAKDVFRCGGNRVCYKLKIKDDERTYIAKQYKNEEYNTRMCLTDDVKALEFGLQLTLEFRKIALMNKDLINHAVLKDIEELKYVQGFLLHIDEKFYQCEELISGDFFKFTLNDSFKKGRPINHIYETFMHFSLSFGEGETLISDIQGSFSTLTDPQIHSTTKFLHNPNNGGQDYINKFNDEHECNSNCIAFNLAEELEQ